MASPDPIAEADVLLAYGRKAQALALLKQAAVANPNRMDIRRKLKSLASVNAQGRSSTATALLHLLFGWLLWLTSLLGVTGGIFLLAWLAFVSVVGPMISDPSAELPFYGVLAVLALLVAMAATAAYVSIVLFVHLWFAYLNLLPIATRRLVDARARTGFSRMEPLYSRIRSKVFRGSDDT